MKRPSMQFYPDAWLSAPELRRCSEATRGIWIDVICLMHFGEPYGHLTTGGHSFTETEVARSIGSTVGRVRTALAELARNGVTARTEQGVIYCRRMVRDEELRLRRASGGEAGAEYGIRGRESGKRGGRPRETPLNGVSGSAHETPLDGGFSLSADEPPSSRARPRPRARPSASSSASASSSLRSEERAPRSARAFDPHAVLAEFPSLDKPEVAAAVDAYLEARLAKHGKWTAQGMRIGLRKLAAGTPAEAVAAFEAATEGPWQTVWPSDGNPRNGHAAAVDDDSRNLEENREQLRRVAAEMGLES